MKSVKKHVYLCNLEDYVPTNEAGRRRIYTLDETLLRTATDPLAWRKEPLPNSCAWHLNLR